MCTITFPQSAVRKCAEELRVYGKVPAKTKMPNQASPDPEASSKARKYTECSRRKEGQG